MIYLIDQSGKIEKTNKDTVIGVANSKTFSIRLSGKIKRQLQEKCRANHQGQQFIYRTFAALVFLLIKGHLKIMTDLIIDNEYPGKEKIIREILLEFLRKFNLPEPHISFGQIGNHPRVHYVAYNVFIGKHKADKEVKLKDIESLVVKNKKDRGLKG